MIRDGRPKAVLPSAITDSPFAYTNSVSKAQVAELLVGDLGVTSKLEGDLDITATLGEDGFEMENVEEREAPGGEA